MKALKIILIIIGIIIAAMLIIPLFVPSTVEVSAEKEIALQPSQLFPTIASFENREKWDPWVSMDSTTKVTIQSKPAFVGSTYSWDGEKLGRGKMEVISVVENENITSSLWFGDVETPSTVEWTFEPADGSTKVIWSFSEETSYPMGRLRMMIGKVFLKQSFESGLTSLKEYIEANPPPMSSLSPITIETQRAKKALVSGGSGPMTQISQDLGRIYGLVMTEVHKQGLEMAGMPFAHYLTFDESTDESSYEAGVEVNGPAKKSGEVMLVSYPEMQVVQAMHTGPYEDLSLSYEKIQKYIQEEGLETNGEVFELYLTDPGMEPDQSNWQTLISFPLK